MWSSFESLKGNIYFSLCSSATNTPTAHRNDRKTQEAVTTANLPQTEEEQGAQRAARSAAKVRLCLPAVERAKNTLYA